MTNILGELPSSIPCSTFPELEQQATEMTTAGLMGQRSRDRLDAMVWALSELSQGQKQIVIHGWL